MLWWYVPGAVRIEAEERLVHVRQLQEREGGRAPEGMLQEGQKPGRQHGHDQPVHESADDVGEQRPRVAIYQGEATRV